MGGKTHSQVAASSRAEQRRRPKPGTEQHSHLDDPVARAEQRAVDDLATSADLLPDPPDLYTAEVIIARGPEYYYTLLGARRYCQYLAQQQVNKELDRQLLRAFDSDSLDPAEFGKIFEQLEEWLGGQYPPAEIAIALERLLSAELIRVEARREPVWSLNLPEPYELQAAMELDSDHRWALINECRVDGAYLAQGQIALLLYRAEHLAENEQQRAILRRLFLSAHSFPDPAYPGARIGDLLFGQALSPGELTELKGNLRSLVNNGALEEVEAGPSNARHYRFAVLPEPESQGARQDTPALGFAANRIIADQGLSGFYQRQGALDYQRRRLLAAAGSDVERHAVDFLYQQQVDDPSLDQSASGIQRQQLIKGLAQRLGLDSKHFATLDNQLLSSQLYRQHLDHWVDSTTGRSYLSLAQIEPRRAAGTVFARQLSVARRAELLADCYGLAGYYRALGQGSELRKRFLAAAERLLPGAKGQQLTERFDPGILDPEQRWLSAEQLWSGVSSQERARTENWLRSKQLLELRPGSDGEEQEYALAGTPSAEIEEHWAAD